VVEVHQRKVHHLHLIHRCRKPKLIKGVIYILVYISRGTNKGVLMVEKCEVPWK
jgi:hypothetical protein